MLPITFADDPAIYIYLHFAGLTSTSIFYWRPLLCCKYRVCNCINFFSIRSTIQHCGLPEYDSLSATDIVISTQNAVKRAVAGALENVNMLPQAPYSAGQSTKCPQIPIALFISPLPDTDRQNWHC